MKPITRADWDIQGWEPMSDRQRRLLNAACSDLTQIQWHGRSFTKDDWRHFLSGVILGHDLVPSVDMGEGAPGFISMARSSLGLNKTHATAAINMAFYIGDMPQEQGIDSPPVDWCDVVRGARGISSADEEIAKRLTE